nr:hypothetical protein [Tanacetum cinerariifolium]
MFKKSKRSLNQAADCIINSVRLKLKSCRWKKSKDALDVAKLWNLALTATDHRPPQPSPPPSLNHRFTSGSNDNYSSKIIASPSTTPCESEFIDSQRVWAEYALKRQEAVTEQAFNAERLGDPRWYFPGLDVRLYYIFNETDRLKKIKSEYGKDQLGSITVDM